MPSPPLSADRRISNRQIRNRRFRNSETLENDARSRVADNQAVFDDHGVAAIRRTCGFDCNSGPGASCNDAVSNRERLSRCVCKRIDRVSRRVRERQPGNAERVADDEDRRDRTGVQGQHVASRPLDGQCVRDLERTGCQQNGPGEPRLKRMSSDPAVALASSTA